MSICLGRKRGSLEKVALLLTLFLCCINNCCQKWSVRWRLIIVCGREPDSEQFRCKILDLKKYYLGFMPLKCLVLWKKPIKLISSSIPMRCEAQHDMAKIFRAQEWDANLCNWSHFGFTLMKGKDTTNSVDNYWILMISYTVWVRYKLHILRWLIYFGLFFEPSVLIHSV